MFLPVISCGAGLFVGCMMDFMVIAECSWILWVVALVNSVG